MLTITYALNALLMMVMPVALGFFLARRLGMRWSLAGAGALTFIASQVFRIPLLGILTVLFNQGALPAPPEQWQLAFNLVILGVSAGVFEEGARYLAFRFWVKSARSWPQALMFGAGHGGVESIIIGVFVALTLVQMIAWRGTDLSALPMTPDQLTALSAQVDAYWAAGWPMTLLGALERAFAICLHISLSVMVLQAVLHKNLVWLLAAIAWHASANMAAVYVLELWGPYASEGVLAIFAAISLWIIFALRRRMPATPPAPPAPPASGPENDPGADQPRLTREGGERLTKEQLDETRYA